MPLSCKETRHYLVAYVDSELDAKTALDMRAHLDGCAACAAEAQGLERETAAVRRAVLSEELGSAALRGKIRAALDEAEESAARSIFRRRRLAGSLALAASALLVAGVAALLWGPSLVNASSFAGRHHLCLKHTEESGRRPAPPEEELREAHALLQQASLPLEKALALEYEGWRFESAHRCKVAGRAFLHAYYRKGEETFSLFLALDDEAAKFAGSFGAKSEEGVAVESLGPRSGVAMAAGHTVTDRAALVSAIRRALETPN